ncbi:MAG: YdcF family protein [Planctomycetia bacterium]|nr:MAG: YdcF family protein [Planctomycetia bacterium]
MAMPTASQGMGQAKGKSPRRSRRRRVLYWGVRLLAALGFFFAVLLFTPLLDVTYLKFDRQGELDKSDYILVLGGDPYRVLEAAELWKEGYAPTVVVSNHDEAAEEMRQLAIHWGVPPERIVVDRLSWTTADHPRGIQQATTLDPATARCIVVTNFMHMARSLAVFEKAGYRRLIFREPRWTRVRRAPQAVKTRLRVLPEVIYECAAWVEYWARGWV